MSTRVSTRHARGSGAFYRTQENQKQVVYSLAFEGGTPRKLCENCCALDISADETKVLTCGKPQAMQAIGLLDVASGRTTELLRGSPYALSDQTLSPDGHWIAFRADRGRLFVVPVRMDRPVVEEREWIAITEPGMNFWPRWSPDGQLLYFISQRDGNACLWAQPLQAATRQPSGEPFPIHHLHVPSRFTGSGLRFDVAAGRLVLRVVHLRSNIWMTKIRL